MALFSACFDGLRADERRVEVAPGVFVSHRSFSAPIDEQPSFGFAQKTAPQLSADRALVAEVAKNLGLEPAYRVAISKGGAALAQGRFRDAGLAEELFLTSLKLNPGGRSAQADYGRLLLIERRPAEAVPLLEAAAGDSQAQAMHFSNLGFAYARTGQNPKACNALAAARSKSPPPGLQSDLALLQKLAAC